MNQSKTRNGYLTVFLIALATSFIFFVPFLIMDKGLFVFYGDFNVQQIPFYKMSHDMIRSGNIFWNWYTDLGANFIGSYSFYLLGSPYFWLTLPFPSDAVPYLLAPLLMLKFATAALTGYGFMKRFVRDPRYATIAALLYAFSGYSIYNVFFNHFHEVIALFPLLLIGLEEFMVNGRKGLFAAAIALNALVNYYFFFGEVLFVIIYFTVRCLYKQDWQLTLKKFLLLALEAVIGLLISAILLLPGLLAIADNPRTSNFLIGWNGIFYNNVQRYGLILHSFFFPPDIPAYPNFFPDSNAKWSSVSMFLPMFSMVGVLAMFKARKRHWTKAIFGISVFMAFIPFLNSAFSAFNTSYYARWFYMPLMIMSLMTAVALENCTQEELRFGVIWSAIPAAFFGLLAIFPSYNDKNELVIGQLPKYLDRLLAYLLVVAMGLVLVWFLIKMDKRFFFKVTTICTCFMVVLTSVLLLALGKGDAETTMRVAETGLQSGKNFTFIKDDPEDFYRIDLNDCMDNLPMYWKIPTIQAFHSVVPGSIFTFYDSLGYDRGVGSRPELKYDALRTLTSVRYLLVYDNKNDPEIYGFYYKTTENGFKIFENENFLPMGFTYDYYVDEETFEGYTKSNRDHLMLSALALTDEQITQYKDILDPLPQEEFPLVTENGIKEAADARKETVCSSFVRDNKGFTAKISTTEPELVFFSVPYDKGFTATVNGAPATVENVNKGFIAVKVPLGQSEIRFDYMAPGLILGIMITLGALAALVIYLWLYHRLSKKKPLIFGKSYTHLNKEFTLPEIAAEEAYTRNIVEKARRIVRSVPLNLPPIIDVTEPEQAPEQLPEQPEKTLPDQESDSVQF